MLTVAVAVLGWVLVAGFTVAAGIRWYVSGLLSSLRRTYRVSVVACLLMAGHQAWFITSTRPSLLPRALFGQVGLLLLVVSALIRPAVVKFVDYEKAIRGLDDPEGP